MAAHAAHDAALDVRPQAGDFQLQARRGGLGRAGVRVQGDARHQGAVQQVELFQGVRAVVGHQQRRAGDQQAVERAGGVGPAGHGAAAQVEHRAAAVLGPDLDLPVGHHGQGQRFRVAAAVADFHHAVAGDLGQRRVDAGLVVGHAHHQRGVGRRRQALAAFVFAAAQVGAEAFVPGQAELGRVVGLGRQGDAPEHRVDGVDARRRRGVGPGGAVVAQVADHDLVALDRRAADAEQQRGFCVVLGRRRVGPRAVVLRQLGGQAPARERPGHMGRLGQVGDVVLGARAVVQRQVVVERAHPVAARPHPQRWRVAVLVGLDAPQVQAHVGDVVAPPARFDAPHVHRAVGALERRAHALQRQPVPQVGRLQVVRAGVVHVLRGHDALEILHGARVPAGHVARELLQHQRRALAPAQGDGVRHLGARAGHLGRDAVQALVADEVADIGHGPVGAGLDEQVVVELLQAFPGHRDLLGQHADQLFERPALQAQGLRKLGVADAVDGRQQFKERLGVGGHGISLRAAPCGAERLRSGRASLTGVPSPCGLRCELAWERPGAALMASPPVPPARRPG